MCDMDFRTPNESVCWFAMSATFAREMKAKDFLEGQGIECYVPMKSVVTKKSAGHEEHILVPAIHNLIFVHTTKAILREAKLKLPYLQYKVHPENGRNVPIIVPDAQMNQFMAICEGCQKQLVFLQPGQVNIAAGTPVRVVGGSLDGLEGTFVKIEGLRNRRFVLEIPNVASVATAEISDGHLEVIK